MGKKKRQKQNKHKSSDSKSILSYFYWAVFLLVLFSITKAVDGARVAKINENLERYGVEKIVMTRMNIHNEHHPGHGAASDKKILYLHTEKRFYRLDITHKRFRFVEPRVAYHIGGEINQICPERKFSRNDCIEISNLP
ncbi:hypothetical protein [Vibrio owensii]|uniref:hypothetical protein n=1 Tax=Vibrio harveyi group TaxID=717610 RepID=UPI003CC63D09